MEKIKRYLNETRNIKLPYLENLPIKNTGELEIVKFYRLFNGRDYADVERKRIIKNIGIYDVNFEFINKKLIKG